MVGLVGLLWKDQELTRAMNVGTNLKKWQWYSRGKLIVEKPTSTGNEIPPSTRGQEQVGALARWSDLGRS